MASVAARPAARPGASPAPAAAAVASAAADPRAQAPRTAEARDVDVALLENACREVLAELALAAAGGAPGGGPEAGDVLAPASLEAIVAKVAARAMLVAPAADGSARSAPAVEPEPAPAPLLGDVAATPWTLWREAYGAKWEATSVGSARWSGSEGDSRGSRRSSPAPKPLRPRREGSSAELSQLDTSPGSASMHSKDSDCTTVNGAEKPWEGSFDAVEVDDESVMEMWNTFSPSARRDVATLDKGLCARTLCSKDRVKSIANLCSPQAGRVCLRDLTDQAADGVSIVTQGLTVETQVAQKLVMRWQGRPRAVLLVAKRGDDVLLEELKDMAVWLSSQKVVVVLESRLLAESPWLRQALPDARTFSAADILERSIDLMVTLGGDGTLTWAVSLFRGPMPPVLSFGAGSLGFLTPFPLEGWVRTLMGLFDLHRALAPLPLVCRMRLQVRVHRRPGGAAAAPAAGDPAAEDPMEMQCLNEVLVHSGGSGASVKLIVGVDGERITEMRGDGLILATPTGSTAYSLAAGGSIVHPGVPAILLTPVSPHSLSFRPALLPQSAVVTVGLPSAARGACAKAALSLDGKDKCLLRAGDSVEVTISAQPVPTICHTTETRDWFGSVNQALEWNG